MGRGASRDGDARSRESVAVGTLSRRSRGKGVTGKIRDQTRSQKKRDWNPDRPEGGGEKSDGWKKVSGRATGLVSKPSEITVIVFASNPRKKNHTFSQLDTLFWPITGDHLLLPTKLGGKKRLLKKRLAQSSVGSWKCKRKSLLLTIVKSFVKSTRDELGGGLALVLDPGLEPSPSPEGCPRS